MQHETKKGGAAPATLPPLWCNWLRKYRGGKNGCVTASQEKRYETALEWNMAVEYNTP